MSAQIEGLKVLVRACRQIIPPQLEFVVLVYAPDGALRMTSVMYPSDKQTPDQQFERAKQAATEFLANKPDPQFNSHKN